MKYDLKGICQDCVYLEKIEPLFEQLQQENQQLKLINKKYERLDNRNTRGFKIISVKPYKIDELIKCEDNWNKLKEWIDNEIEKEHHTRHWDVLRKMQELERGVSDE